MCAHIVNLNCRHILTAYEVFQIGVLDSGTLSGRLSAEWPVGFYARLNVLNALRYNVVGALAQIFKGFQ